LIDEEVTALVLALIIIGGVFIVGQATVGERVSEPFSAIAVLGPKMRIGDYPTTVTVNQIFRLYLHIINYEGHTTYYVVYVKLGNNLTSANATNPANAPTIQTFETIVSDGSSRTLPMDLVIREPQANVKLIFEMWTLEKDGLRYSGRWNQIWLNITAPT